MYAILITVVAGLVITFLGTIATSAFLNIYRIYTGRKAKRQDEKLSDLRSRYIEGRIDRKMLFFYYSDANSNRSSDRASNRLAPELKMFSVWVGTLEIKARLATRPEWTFLGIPITAVQCRLNATSDPMKLEDARCNADYDYVTSLQKKRIIRQSANGVRVWNSPIYRLNGIKIDRNGGLIQVDFSIDEFINHYNSNCLMEIELEDALIRNGNDIQSVANDSSSLLQLREHIIPNGAKLLDVSGRLCAGGVCAVFAVAREDDYLIPLVVRSDKVAIGGGRLSLVPQGLHQPISALNQEVKLIDTLYRELYEEFFGGREVDDVGARLPPRWYLDQCSPLEWIDSHLEQCTIEIVSFGFNLVNGNYEFGTLLAVRDPAFWTKYERCVQGGWEGSPFILASTKETEELKNLMIRKDWVPEAQAAFIQGLSRLSEISPNKVRLPRDFRRSS